MHGSIIPEVPWMCTNVYVWSEYMPNTVCSIDIGSGQWANPKGHKLHAQHNAQPDLRRPTALARKRCKLIQKGGGVIVRSRTAYNKGHGRHKECIAHKLACRTEVARPTQK